MQLVHRLGVLVGIVVLVLVELLVADVDGLAAGGWWRLVIHPGRVECGRWCEQAVDGEIDGAVDDRRPGRSWAALS
jgi:hypothetical protein